MTPTPETLRKLLLSVTYAKNELGKQGLAHVKAWKQDQRRIRKAREALEMGEPDAAFVILGGKEE